MSDHKTKSRPITQTGRHKQNQSVQVKPNKYASKDSSNFFRKGYKSKSSLGFPKTLDPKNNSEKRILNTAPKKRNSPYRTNSSTTNQFHSFQSKHSSRFDKNNRSREKLSHPETRSQFAYSQKVEKKNSWGVRPAFHENTGHSYSNRHSNSNKVLSHRKGSFDSNRFAGKPFRRSVDSSEKGFEARFSNSRTNRQVSTLHKGNRLPTPPHLLKNRTKHGTLQSNRSRGEAPNIQNNSFFIEKTNGRKNRFRNQNNNNSVSTNVHAFPKWTRSKKSYSQDKNSTSGIDLHRTTSYKRNNRLDDNSLHLPTKTNSRYTSRSTYNYSPPHRKRTSQVQPYPKGKPSFYKDPSQKPLWAQNRESSEGKDGRYEGRAPRTNTHHRKRSEFTQTFSHSRSHQFPQRNYRGSSLRDSSSEKSFAQTNKTYPDKLWRSIQTKERTSQNHNLKSGPYDNAPELRSHHARFSDKNQALPREYTTANKQRNQKEHLQNYFVDWNQATGGRLQEEQSVALTPSNSQPEYSGELKKNDKPRTSSKKFIANDKSNLHKKISTQDNYTSKKLGSRHSSAHKQSRRIMNEKKSDLALDQTRKSRNPATSPNRKTSYAL